MVLAWTVFGLFADVIVAGLLAVQMAVHERVVCGAVLVLRTV